MIGRITMSKGTIDVILTVSLCADKLVFTVYASLVIENRRDDKVSREHEK